MALDFPRSTAVANAYLQSGADRKAYQATVALAACKFQDDPHNQKITPSRPSRSTRTTRPICATGCCSPPRGCSPAGSKMPGERDCYARFEKDWIYN